MDFLFVSVMEYLRDEGFKYLQSRHGAAGGHVGAPGIAPVWDKIGRTVFEHGERFYNFKGLKAFKSKFHPHWQPRYMAAGGGINPILA